MIKIFIDADIFIALLNRQDCLHEKTCNLLKNLNKKAASKYQFYTSWDVITEAATKISYSLKKKQAIAFLKYLEKIKTNIIYINYDIAKKAKNLFENIQSKRVSMTDCANIEIVKLLKLDYIFSFDKIYKKQGLVLLNSVFKKTEWQN